MKLVIAEKPSVGRDIARVLGCSHFGDYGRGYSADFRGRTDGNLHAALRDVEAAEAYHRVREIARKSPFRARTLSECGSCCARGLHRHSTPKMRAWRG